MYNQQPIIGSTTISTYLVWKCETLRRYSLIYIVIYKAGEFSPFSPIKGLYFDDSPEPDKFYYELVKELSDKYKKKGIHQITLNYDNAEDFYAALTSLDKFSNDNIKIYSTSKVGNYDVVVQDAVDLDDGGAPSIDADAKKKTKKEKEAEAKRQKEEDEKMAALEEAAENSAKEEELPSTCIVPNKKTTKRKSTKKKEENVEESN